MNCVGWSASGMESENPARFCNMETCGSHFCQSHNAASDVRGGVWSCSEHEWERCGSRRHQHERRILYRSRWVADSLCCFLPALYLFTSFSQVMFWTLFVCLFVCFFSERLIWKHWQSAQSLILLTYINDVLWDRDECIKFCGQRSNFKVTVE